MVATWERLTGRRVAADILYWEIFAVMRYCAIFVRLGDRFVRAGLGDPSSPMSVQNPVTDALARLLVQA